MRLLLCVLLSLSAPAAAGPKADALVSNMSLTERLSLTHGMDDMSLPPVERLGIPRWRMTDGPHGPRGDNSIVATAFPSPIALAASWDTALLRRVGAVQGSETRAFGRHMLLAPGINIIRTPIGGRSFEYFSEDPFLVASLTPSFVRGAQDDAGAAVSVKHFAANSVERDRMTVDARVDERTLREIYLPGFKAAVDAGAATLMAAYNRLNGAYCAENAWLLDELLRKEWGFKGFVVSDWGAVHGTLETALHGVDVEMPGGTTSDFFGTPLAEAVRKGQVPVSAIDDKARRVLGVMERFGALDGTEKPGVADTPEHQSLARQAATEGLVLLKNEGGLLPLDKAKLRRVAVIGPLADARTCRGGGSSEMNPPYEVTVAEGLKRKLAGRAELVFHADKLESGEGLPAYVTAATEAARQADAAILVVGTSKDYDHEGGDKPGLGLMPGQDQLVEEVLKAKPDAVVVLVNGSAVEMPWIGSARAVLEAWFPGMEGGNAVAAALLGETNPGGKLPITFPKSLADVPAHANGNVPGADKELKYDEGLLVGYRHYDTKGVEPLFPFGHGLSYTSFGYKGLASVKAGDGFDVYFTVTNTGRRAGSETAQLYLRELKPSLERPFQELKGFSKVTLKPGESRRLSIHLPAYAFAFWDPGTKAWTSNKGEFEARIGSSSRDIRLTTTLKRL